MTACSRRHVAGGRSAARLKARDILALTRQHDIGGGRGLVVPSEYAEIVVATA